MGGGELRRRELPPLLDDLKLRILRSSTLYPSEPTKRRLMFLSNIDQVLNFSVDTVHFFAAGEPEFGFEAVEEILRSAVERLLVAYDFLAGRLRVEEGRLVIDCNRAGVGFAVAESGLRIDELGELEYPNPIFRQLATAGSPEMEKGFGLKMDDHPLCSFQVTSFKCGGFAMGISNNHATFDGISFKAFLQNLAALAGGGNLATVPFTDRRLLSVRSPPRVTFPHPELVEASAALSSMLDPSPADLHFRLFRFSAADIAALKLLAHPHASRPTSFNVVVAHIWRCKSLCSTPAAEPEKTSTVLYAVDIRGRLRPPLPHEYAGNAVLTAYGEATAAELAAGPFWRLVEAVAKGAERMQDEYARSVIDWGSLHNGYPKGDIFVSSWWRLGFAGVEYPWGKPLYTCPVAHPRRDIVLLFPSIVGEDNAGVNALVALPREDLDRFGKLLYSLLPQCGSDA
ncbi:Rosmarinate synthase [Platanthera guangdongensis]|uniref:Rosmarinate synthase n=1 Tax=Platanthera guangdongensis TaxID=2320717 RepID=A0ABR2N0F8_9ASPA